MNNFKKGHGFGFGKTIFFGEHFVVYGLPAIVSALSFKTTAIVENFDTQQKSFELIDFRPKVPTFNPERTRKYRIAIVQNILKEAGIKNNIKITLAGDLTVCSGGIGASAAFSAALTKALNNFLDLKWDIQKINKVTFQGEKGAHGTPSGIDNTAAVFGKTFCFKKSAQENFIEQIKLQEPIEIVLADSGIVGGTKNVVGLVKKFKEENKDKVSLLFNDYRNLFEKAKTALINFDLKEVGNLMNKNHELLKKLNVSCDVLDEMVDIARAAGALGAKLTGTGKGGLIVALTPGKILQEKVAKELNKKGFFTLKTSVG